MGGEGATLNGTPKTPGKLGLDGARIIAANEKIESEMKENEWVCKMCQHF